MKTIIYIILAILLLTQIANAQEYSTSYTAVYSENDNKLLEETTMFFYTDSTLEVVSPTLLQRFKVTGMVHNSLYNLEDEQGECATIQYFVIKQKKFLRKPKIKKIIGITYDKQYLFYFEKP